MGTNTLETAYSNGQIIDASHINELTAAVINQFVGRNTSGVPESGKSLGTAAIPWGAVHANSLILNGSVVDTGQITSVANRIVSGATRADSDQPQFLDADGTAATMTVLGASTNITLSINASAVTVSTDIVKTGLTLAPSANNTCLVNDTAMVNDLYAGEVDAVIKEITIDTLGSEVTAKIGQYVGFKTATGEIMYGYLESATKITNVFRGFFFDDTGAPIVRGNLSNNDTLTLINIGWVFVEDNGTTVDISYLQPTYSFEAPSGPATGQYWFDIPNQVWKRYSGTEFEIINRMLIGIIALDDTACIATRSGDFTNTFQDLNNVELEINSTEIVTSKNFSSRVSVYGGEVVQDLNKLSWNMTTDLESGLSEASSTKYYAYISTKGERIISDQKPYLRKDLKGLYHPYHTWRSVGRFFNDSSSDIVRASDYVKFNSYLWLTTSNGYGSTNTVIRRFATVLEYTGMDFSYNDDTETTNGTEITIHEDGVYALGYSEGTSSANIYGFSLNSTQLSTAYTTINQADKLLQTGIATSTASGGLSNTVSLKAGDIVRPHITNAGGGDAPYGRLIVARVA
jgi:hypothetical protein